MTARLSLDVTPGYEADLIRTVRCPRSLRVAVLLALLVAACFTLSVGSAGAAPSTLTFDRCYSAIVSACAPVPALREASAVAVSPDGRSVYATARASNAISHFSRNPVDGNFAFVACYANPDPADACEDLPRGSLATPNDLVVSPDGKSVYVVSQASDSITHFARSDSGALAQMACYANDDSAGCIRLEILPGIPTPSLDGAEGVAISPDGRFVYVVSVISDSLSYFKREPSSGALTYGGCHANGASDGCVDEHETPFTGATGVAVSPDGASVYLAASEFGALAHFRRVGQEGQLVYDGCYADTSADGCEPIAGASLGGASDVVVSPVDESVHVVSRLDNSLTHFERASALGQPRFVACVASAAAGTACGGAPIETMRQGTDVALSTDGESLYVTGPIDDAISYFRRSGPSLFAFDGCIGAGGRHGCTTMPGGVLDGPAGVTVSPDGRSVYAADFTGASVSHFFRGPVPPPPPPPPPPPGDRAPPETRITAAPPRSTMARTARFRFTSNEAPSSFQCRLDRRKRWTRCASPLLVKGLRQARHVFRVRAIDAAGNADPTPAKRRWNIVRG